MRMNVDLTKEEMNDLRTALYFAIRHAADPNMAEEGYEHMHESLKKIDEKLCHCILEDQITQFVIQKQIERGEEICGYRLGRKEKE